MLDRYLEEHFWLFHLAFLAASAILVARTASLLLEGALLPGPELGETSAPARAPTSGARVEVGAFLERNVFHAARSTPPQPGVEAPLGALEVGGCGPSTLPLALLGTVVTRAAQDSVALFDDDAEKVSLVHRVGDRVLGEAELIRVEARQVFLARDGRCERLTLDGSVLSATSPRPSEERTADRPDVWPNVRKVTEAEYELPRADLERALGHMDELAAGCRIVPSFEGGRAKGFKMFSIRPGSLFHKLGVENGDVIERVNGDELTSAEAALIAYGRLRDAEVITVDVRRRGGPTTLTYRIR